MRRKILFAVLVLLCLVTLSATAAEVFKDRHASEFGGEYCLRCHTETPAVRRQAPAETFDVVIVGGGMAGLSALHYLQDVNAVVLEAQHRTGGQMCYNSWKGIRYAEGAAYFVEPYGILAEYYRSENIPLVKIHEPENSAWIGGRFYPACWTAEGRAHMPWTGPAKENWVRFLEDLEKVNTLSLSCQPFEMFSDEQQQLELISARDWMKQRGLTDEMIRHIDRYTPSCFGVESDQISAAALTNYLSGEIGGNYTMPGGLGAVQEIIYKNHQDRIRLGCKVLRIEQNADEARVTYLDPDGKQKTVRAKAVITAVPCNLLPRLIPDLPKEKVEVIAQTKYAAYLVAAVLCKEVLWDDKGYDTWIQDGYFRDIIDATWISRDGKPYENKKQPHVLSLYIPQGVEGTAQMIDMDPKVIKRQILTDLEKVLPGCSKKVEDIRLNRFGHSMHVAAPGFMTRTVPILRKPYFRISFAGAEVEGLPCNESAIISGYKAAAQVRTWLWPERPTELRGLVESLRKKHEMTPAAQEAVH